MKTSSAAKFLPIYSDEKKVEVSLQDNQALITLSTWSEDLGWLRQKTMSLDAEMLGDLHRVISSARCHLNKQKTVAKEKEASTNVIAFPKFS